MAEQQKPFEIKLSKFELCKSGRPKKVVMAELVRERAKLEDLTTHVQAHLDKRRMSEIRFEKWVERWRNDQRAAGLPTDPVDVEEYPYKRIELDMPLVEDHQRQHYVIAALEEELEEKDKK